MTQQCLLIPKRIVEYALPFDSISCGNLVTPHGFFRLRVTIKAVSELAD